MGDVKLNSAGGGSVTLTTPSTASNLTVTLPSASGTLATTSGTGSVFTNPTINGFTGDTSVVNIGSGQFYKDTSGNVGIGTSSPSYKLQIQNSSADTNTFVGQASGVGMFTQWRYNATAANAYGEISTYGGNNSIYIQAQNGGGNTILNSVSGNVGIGTSSPARKVQVNVSPSASGDDGIRVTDGTRLLQSSITGSSYSYKGIGANETLIYSVGNPLNIASDGQAIKFITGSGETMRLDSSGNLGLGVTPSAWVSGFSAFQAGNVTSLYNDNNNNTIIARNAYRDSVSNKYIISSAAQRILFNNDGSFVFGQAPSGTAGNAISFTQAMTLDASGNLLVGTTSASGRITCYGNTGGVNTVVATQSVAGGYNYLSDAVSNGGTYYHAQFKQAGTPVGSITSTGTTTTYATSSDQRLKTNIAPAGSAIQSILNFPVDQFDWIADGTHQDFGAVAQKAIRFIPEMVTAPANEDEMWGIDWSKAVPRLIKTIQELSAKNSELESRLAALEGK